MVDVQLIQKRIHLLNQRNLFNIQFQLNLRPKMIFRDDKLIYTQNFKL
jgi:hypothetical protein